MTSSGMDEARERAHEALKASWRADAAPRFEYRVTLECDPRGFAEAAEVLASAAVVGLSASYGARGERVAVFEFACTYATWEGLVASLAGVSARRRWYHQQDFGKGLV